MDAEQKALLEKARSDSYAREHGPELLAEVRQLQERVRQLELEAGEDANRQDLLKMLVGKIRSSSRNTDPRGIDKTSIQVMFVLTRAQFNAMAEAVGEKGLG